MISIEKSRGLPLTLQMPHEPTEEQLQQLRDAILARQKIEAIRLYREFSGRDLKDAKDYIEQLTADLEKSHPEKFTPKRSGCSAVVLLLLLIVFSFCLFKAKGEIATEKLPTLDEALAARTDIWGIAAMQQTNGASYDFFVNLLPPLRYVNAAFRNYPIVLSGPGAPVKARLISNGSAVNALAKLNTWKEIGVPVTFRVGTNQEIFGNDLRRLDEPFFEKGYLPIVHLKYENAGVVYEQETFAATETPLAEHGVVFVQFKTSRTAPIGRITAKIDSQFPLTERDGALIDSKGATFIWFGKDWKWNATNKTLEALLENKKAILTIATKPFANSVHAIEFSNYAAQKRKCIRTWEKLLDGAMKVQTPESVVNSAWKSTIIGSFILLRGDHMNYSAGNAYDVMYEAESGDVVRALMRWGLLDKARKMIPPLLDYGINPGLRFHDAAFKLQLVADYFFLTHDADFVRSQKARWEKCTQILTAERDAQTGLLPREDYCGDIHQKVFSLNSNANAWRGLRDIAVVLDLLNEGDEAQKISDVAKQLRESIFRAVDQSEFRDTKPPFIPVALFGAEKPYDVLTSTMLGSYWDLMIPYVIGSQVFDANSARETSMIHYLERHGGICVGMIRFHQHSKLFANEDGLDDGYSLRYIDALLHRDEPEKALVSFYGKLAQGMTRNTFLSAEGTGLRPLDEFGRPMYLPPTCTGSGFFLSMLRNMLIQDYDLNNDGKPETLRLLFATSKNWLEDGKQIRVENAPTAFGKISVHVISRLKKGEITANVQLPKKNSAAKTQLRIRVPEGWEIISAKLGSRQLHVDENGTVDISNANGNCDFVFKVKRL